MKLPTITRAKVTSAGAVGIGPLVMLKGLDIVNTPDATPEILVIGAVVILIGYGIALFREETKPPSINRD